ncbi:MAG: anthranilate synthase component I family protein [Flavobacteriales bacterium]|nr:anthranilate synthase component I family protein [Flavobacteriales bacterium]
MTNAPTQDPVRRPAGPVGRVSVEVPAMPGWPCWEALREERAFLFRRLADQGRWLLFVGERSWGSKPRFSHADDHGVYRALDWSYGHCAYDLKNELETLVTRHPDPFGYPTSRWSVPRWVVEGTPDRVVLHAHAADLEEGLGFCRQLFGPAPSTGLDQQLDWALDTPRDRYLQQVESLMDHIQLGDIYEVNHCVSRHAHAPGFDPFAAFGKLLERTDAAFAAFHRMGDRFGLCASPERFLHFVGRRVIAQPMKGTRPRSRDAAEDARLAQELAHDAKERGENIMAVDVMRNDLARVSSPGSVAVEELCAVRPHARVHQMTSTISAELRSDATPWDAVRAAFPMASMTGAPKIRAMELIDALEDRARGLFSGTLGHFSPDGTGDLNVVIRTVLHDAATGHTSLTTGSAITAACDPAAEWEECELKARSVIDALGP